MELIYIRKLSSRFLKNESERLKWLLYVALLRSPINSRSNSGMTEIKLANQTSNVLFLKLLPWTFPWHSIYPIYCHKTSPAYLPATRESWWPRILPRCQRSILSGLLASVSWRCPGVGRPIDRPATPLYNASVSHIPRRSPLLSLPRNCPSSKSQYRANKVQCSPGRFSPSLIS